MDEVWKETFLLHSETDEYKNRVKQTKESIKYHLEQFKKPYLAFSGGKDSTVMLHLVLEFIPNIMVFHWDYGCYMPEAFEKEIIKNAKQIGVTNLQVETSEQYKYNPTSPIWYKCFFGRILPRLIKEGFDCAFVGLRKEESSKRTQRIIEQKNLSKMSESWPLADWTWKDVWAYIVSNNIPYMSTYDDYAKIWGWDRVRFTTFFDPEMEKFGAPYVDGVLLWRHKHGQRIS